MHRSNRLYWRIWFAVLAAIVAVALLVGIAWKVFADQGPGSWRRDWAHVAAALLPPAATPRDDQVRVLREWSGRLNAELSLYGADRALIGSTAHDMPSTLQPEWDGSDDFRLTDRGPAFVVRIPDGRVLLVRRQHRGGPLGVIATLMLIALAVGLGAYPVARRLTRRLERLQAGVNQLGRGDLRARVAVEGTDEVAQLAQSFNAAAGRIEALVHAQRSLLANASHELRSPLARVRMAIEMLRADARPELKAELERNVAELDALIDEILLASRLDAAAPLNVEEVDVTAVAAEECARVDASLDAAPVLVRGEMRLIRRMLRNLLENARRHGGDTPIDVRIAPAGAQVEIDVCDRGPGVPASERERIFEPFYRMPGASEAAGGVGLGLALVQKIAVQHGGSVTCLPRDGAGSCFRVRLPIEGPTETPAQL